MPWIRFDCIGHPNICVSVVVFEYIVFMTGAPLCDCFLMFRLALAYPFVVCSSCLQWFCACESVAIDFLPARRLYLWDCSQLWNNVLW